MGTFNTNPGTRGVYSGVTGSFSSSSFARLRWWFASALLLLALAPGGLRAAAISDLKVFMGGPTAVGQGQSITYHFSIVNAGPDEVPAAYIQYLVPAGLLGVNWTCQALSGYSSCGNTYYGTGDINLTTGKIGVGIDNGLGITLSANAPNANAILQSSVIANVLGNASDPVLANNSSTLGTNVSNTADLWVALSDGLTNYVPGTSITYLAFVGNAGASGVSMASFSDPLPAALTGITWTCDGLFGATCPAAGVGSPSNVSLTLPAKGYVLFQINATVKAGTSGALVNTATVAALAPAGLIDPDTANNTGIDTDMDAPYFKEFTNLVVSAAGSAHVPAGGTVSYQLKVQNLGSSTAHGVVLVDKLPASLANATWSCIAHGADSNCGAVSGTGDVNLQIDSVGARAEDEVIVMVTGQAPNVPTLLQNSAEVSVSDGISETNVIDNISEPVTTAVGHAPVVDLAIQKTAPAAVGLGAPISYVLTVMNFGDAIENAVITDILPADLSGAAWTCTAYGFASCGQSQSGVGNLSLTTGVLTNTPGSYLSISITANAPAFQANIVNTATVSTPFGVVDWDTSNNSAVASTTVAPTDLSITVSDGVTSYAPGDTLTYTITVHNTGPDTVSGAAVSDALPAALTGASWTCTGSGGAHCPASGTGGIATSAVDLPANATATFILTATVAAGTSGSLSNTATVSAPAGINDPNPANNSDTDTDALAQANNTPPVGVDDAAQVTVGGTLDTTAGGTLIGGASSVLANDLNPNNDVLTATLLIAPQYVASFTLNPNGTFSYTHSGKAVGNDSFVYLVCDPQGACTSAQVTITISNSPTINQVPVAVDDALQAMPGGAGVTALTGGATSVLDNDYDPDSDALTASLLAAPTKGTLNFNANGVSGAFSYQANSGVAIGTLDHFDYQACDPHGVCAAATVTILIGSKPNQLPVAANDAMQVAAGATTSTLVGGAASVLDNDSDPDGDTLTTKLLTAPAGQLQIHADGTFNYTAPASGVSDTFVYEACDKLGACAAATVAITIGAGGTPVADLSVTKTDGVTSYAPGGLLSYTIAVHNAGPDAATGVTVTDTLPAALSGASWTCTGTGGASCPANGSGSIATSAVNLPANATATFTLTATVAAGTSGSLSNTAAVSAPAGVTDPNPANDSDTDTDALAQANNTPPVGVDDAGQVTVGGTLSTTAGGTLIGGATSVLTNDSDADPGDTLTASVLIAPQHAALFKFGYDGTFTYTHDGSTALGVDSFVYLVCDSQGACASAKVTITIIGVADLSVTKTDGVTSYAPGGLLSYTIAVHNAGPDAATGVTVTDTLPAALTGATWKCAGTGGASCPASGSGSIATSAVTLPVNATATFTLTATVAAGTSGSLSNTATVSAPAGINDPNPANDSDTDTDALAQANNTPPVGVDDAGQVTVGGAVAIGAGGVLNGGATSVLANDYDLDGDALTASLLIAPQHASKFELDLNGAFAYMHDGTTAASTDSFVYEVCDTKGACTSAQVTITVTNSATQNQLPVAANDNVTVPPSGTATTLVGGQTTLLWNDSDPDAGDTLSAQLLTGALHGAVTVNLDGTFSYTNTDIAAVSDSFVYEACDNHGACTAATVTVTIGAGGMPQADLSVTKTDGVTSYAPGGLLTYTIAVHNAGPDAANGVTVTDTLPAALSGASWTCTGTGGASCPANGSGSIATSAVNLPANATATFTLTATVAAGTSGSLSNTATVSAPAGLSDPNPANDSDTDTDALAQANNTPPVGVDDAGQLAVGGTLDTSAGGVLNGGASSVLANDYDLDGDALTAAVQTAPAHAASFKLNTDGTFSYSHDGTTAASTDSFVYQVCDPKGACTSAKVTLSLSLGGNPTANQVPVAVDDALQAVPGGPAVSTLIGGASSVLANDADPEGDALTASLLTAPTKGTLSFNVNGVAGAFSYQANGGVANGTLDHFDYQACDSQGACAAATVTITISSSPTLNQLPVAGGDNVTVPPSGTATTLVGGQTTLLWNDSDPDAGDTLVAYKVGAPAHGTATVNADGTFSYTNTDPAALGDSFVYEACDNHGACTAATVTVAINGSAPSVACHLNKQVYSVGGSASSVDLSKLFSAPAGKTLTYSATGLPAAWTLNPGTGLLSIVLNGVIPGSYSGSLKATVGGGLSAAQTTTFQVLAANELIHRNGFDLSQNNCP